MKLLAVTVLIIVNYWRFYCRISKIWLQVALLLLLFSFISTPVNAKNWGLDRGYVLVESFLSSQIEYAHICHVWNAIIFAPGETASCSWNGTLFVVDLATRKIYYAPDDALKSYSNEQLKLKAEVLAIKLRGEGYDKLETMREKQIVALTEENAKIEAAQAKEEYFRAYEAATSIAFINDFERRYSNNDPDKLIPKLEPLKLQLEMKQYQDRFDAAKSSSELQSFILNYESKGPDRLIPEAKRRLAAVLMVEQAEQARLIREKLADEEKRKREQAIEQRANELARKKEAKDESRNRLQFIKNLRVRYSKNLTSESPHALEIVSSFIISCRAPDHRVLPLLNVLFAQIANAGPGFEFKLQIRSRGNAVRIFSDLYHKGKRLRETKLAWEISEWNELRPVGITTEAVLNSCYGTQGPIWLMPDERL